MDNQVQTTTASLSPHLLLWRKESESIKCNAQGLISNSTEHVWISCKKYIGRGRLVVDSNNDPIEIVMDVWNKEALDGPQALTQQAYAHIGDGDYVILEDGSRREVWFGLEGGSWPRVLNASIARYDAETLEFVGLLFPPNSMRTMPFLVYHESRQLVYTTNWTENYGDLIVFDTKEMKWLNTNATVKDLPESFGDDLHYIQGGDMVGDVLYLMVDDFRSSLMTIQMTNASDQVNGGHLHSISYLGLGHEREGITLFRDWLLSMDNQWTTWEGLSYAEIVCVRMSPPMDPRVASGSMWLDFSFGTLLGLCAGLLVSCVVLVRSCKLRSQNLPDPSYEMVEQL